MESKTRNCRRTKSQGVYFTRIPVPHLGRRYDLAPYRYKRQRYTTVMVRVPKSFVDQTLWPEYQQLKAALEEYLNDATDRIIREEVYRDAGEAPERAG